MENLSHSRKPNRGSSQATLNKRSGTCNGVNNFNGKSMYDDVFGGPPRFGAGGPALSPRPEDYTEIFGGFHASRGASIPVLDLPLVDENDEVMFDVRNPRFNYAEVFGGFDSLDFAASYEELMTQANGVDDHDRDGASSEEAWMQAETESLSEGSDHSGNYQHFSNGDFYEPIDSSMEFNISYHKANLTSNREMSNGITHVAQLHADPEYAYIIETPLQKTDSQNPPLSVTGDIDLEFPGGVTRKKHLRKTVSQPSNWTSGEQKFTNASTQKEYRRNASSNEMFVTISEINLRTLPSDVPPPSRPPPHTNVKNGEFQNVQPASSGGRMGDYSPPYFDVEIDASSAAAASAAAMKEAMDKAQAKLKSAKELLERKREGMKNSTIPGSKSDGKSKKERARKAVDGSDDVNEEKVQGMFGQEASGVKISVREERQKAMKTQAPESLESEKVFNAPKKFSVEKHLKDPQIQEFDETDGADEWQEATQFFELVRTDKSRMGFEQTNSEKVFIQNSKSNELQHKAKKAIIGALEQQLDSDKKVGAVREDHELEKVEQDMKTAKESCERGEYTGISKTAKEARRHKGHEKKIKASQDICDLENGQTMTARKHLENVKKPTGADDLEKHEKWVNAQQKENKVEVGQVMEQKEDKNETEMKQFIEQAENEKRLKEAFEQEEKEKRLKEAHEQEENEKRLKEAREHEEKERRLKEAHDREEKERRLKEACEQEEEERRLKEAHERKEKEKKLKEARECEEKEKRLKEACEQEEKEKKLKKAHEREEKEKRLKQAYEREEKEKRLKEAREREENEKRLKEAREREEKEKRLKREENEKRLKEVREQEENEKRLKEVREQEENEKRLKEAREREENEKRLKEAREREENAKKEKEARELEESEKIWRMALEQIENEKRLKQACIQEDERRQQKALEQEEMEDRREVLEKEESKGRSKLVTEQGKVKEVVEREESRNRCKEACEKEVNDMGLKKVSEKEDTSTRLKEIHEKEDTGNMVEQAVELKDYNKPERESQDKEDEVKQQAVEQEETEELQGVNYAYQQVENDKNGKKLKDAKETLPYVEGEDPVVFDEVNKVECSKTGRENQFVGNNDQMPAKLEDTEESILYRNGKMETEFRDGEQKSEATERSNDGEKLNASGMAPCDVQVKTDQVRKGDISNLCHQNGGVKKAGEAGIGIGQKNAEKINCATGMDYENDNQGLKFTYEWRERARSFKDTQVPSHLENRDRFMAAQAVKESVETGREVEATKSSFLEGKGSTHRTVQQGKISLNTDRKDKNINESPTPEEKEAERLKRDKEQEIERLRKIEEEREREREREKDRISVDRAALEARERGYAEVRDRAERAAVERATAEARQRAMAEARDRLEKACAEAREKSSIEARIRAERAAVERATAEARERAVEKAMAERAASEARERVERSMSDKFSTASRNNGLRTSSSSSDLQDQHFQSNSSFGGLRYPYSSAYNGVEGESAQRCKARLERYRRTADRAAKALEEKNMRDLLALREQAERNRLAETLDADVKRWSSGKEGNLRALLSTLQYILGPDSGWQPIPLTEVITSAAVKKAYRKATLCVHPDKLQQRGASIQQKYICEKVFDLLKEAWNKFNSEER